MNKYTVKVTKLTNEQVMRDACNMTFNGISHQSLLGIYKSEHSPVRTQIFWIELKNIPLFVSTHLLRHHVGSTPYQLTCRKDRQGANTHIADRVANIKSLLPNIEDNKDIICQQLDDIVNNCDRNTPVNLGLFINAQSLIDMSKLRLCNQASVETRQVFQSIKDKIQEIDPELAAMMVRKCVYRNGLCGEPKCCKFNNSKEFTIELNHYLKYFNEFQRKN